MTSRNTTIYLTWTGPDDLDWEIEATALVSRQVETFNSSRDPRGIPPEVSWVVEDLNLRWSMGEDRGWELAPGYVWQDVEEEAYARLEARGREEWEEALTGDPDEAYDVSREERREEM